MAVGVVLPLIDGHVVMSAAGIDQTPAKREANRFWR